MNDLDKIIELGKQFAEPWKKATKVLSVLLIISVIAVVFVSCKSKTIRFNADFNNESEISQIQG